MNIKKTVFSVLIFSLFYNPAHADQRVDIGQFSRNDVSGWKQKSFVGETQYKLVNSDNRTVLQADSEQTASAYYFSKKIDLSKTPVLNWSWRKQGTLNPGDETVKAGDDFVARVYVIKSGGLFVWNTRAINYVWSYQHDKAATWDNPFAGKNARMVAQRSAQDEESVWFTESRNIIQDFAELYDKEIDHIDGVAIMTDSDNSGLSASAQYGDIYFTSE